MLNKKTAVLTLIATAALGGGVAFAYPEDTAMAVSASPSAGVGGKTNVLVTVSASNPGCPTLVQVDGAAAVLLGAGQTTTTITVDTVTGRHRVSARTVNCKGAKEHASSRYLILAGASSQSAPTAELKKNYRIALTGFAPGTVLTLVATGPAGSTQLSASDTADSRGNAKVKFKFRMRGTWTIVTTSSPAGASIAPIMVTVS